MALKACIVAVLLSVVSGEGHAQPRAVARRSKLARLYVDVGTVVNHTAVAKGSCGQETRCVAQKLAWNLNFRLESMVARKQGSPLRKAHSACSEARVQDAPREGRVPAGRLQAATAALRAAAAAARIDDFAVARPCVRQRSPESDDNSTAGNNAGGVIETPCGELDGEVFETVLPEEIQDGVLELLDDDDDDSEEVEAGATVPECVCQMLCLCSNLIANAPDCVVDWCEMVCAGMQDTPAEPDPPAGDPPAEEEPPNEDTPAEPDPPAGDPPAEEEPPNEEDPPNVNVGDYDFIYEYDFEYDDEGNIILPTGQTITAPRAVVSAPRGTSSGTSPPPQATPRNGVP